MPVMSEVPADAAALAELYAYPGEGTWLRANMVSSVDGAVAVQGRSGGLGNATDFTIFHLQRALADVIIVGVETVREEGYGPAVPEAGWIEAGLRRGRPPAAPIAVVSRRLDIDPGARIFADAPPDARTIVLTTASAPAAARAALAEVADVIVAGETGVDWPAAVRALADRGHRRLHCEGGPTILGLLAAAGVLDELCLTLSPLLVAGDAHRILAGPPLPAPLPCRLGHVLTDADGYLFLRYVAAR
jgi:riboflavin biosynthesis pyrimidine reductase